MHKKRSALIVTVLIVTAIIIVVNWLVGAAGLMNFRLDLTEKKLYTLSDGTKRILANIKPDQPVTIRFYATGDSRLMPPFFSKYASTVEDLLLEMEKASDNKLTLQRIDPRPDSDAEDKAVSDDIAGQQVDAVGDKVYFGLAVESGDRKEVIPSLDPNAETSLEYDIARAIAKVDQVKKPVIGVMSAMPIAGPAVSFPGMPQQGPPPWAVIQQLRQDYEVREVHVSANKIDADIGILLIIHPADIRPITEYAVDQFLLRGGKVVAFVDPKSVVSNMYNQQQQNPMMGMQSPTVPASSDLKKLFPAWGIGYDPEKIVADMTDATQIGNGQTLPTFLTIGTKDGGINQNEPVTAQLERIQMYTPGAFTITKKEGIKTVTLLKSSENSELIDSTEADKAQRGPLDSFRSEGHANILGVELTGHFKTAFPEGPPKDVPPPGGDMPQHMGPGMIPPGVHGTGGSDKDAGAPATPAKDDKPAASTATTPPVTVTTPPVSAAQTPAPAPAKAAPAKPAPAPASAAPAPAAAKPATPAPAPAPAAAPAKPAGPPQLKESTNNEGVVFVFSDSDMLYDRICFRFDQFNRPAELLNHNMPMLLNIVELLNGGSDLIAVRSRGSTKRSFSKFQQMSDAVAAKYRPRIEELAKKRADAEKEASKIKSLELKVDSSGKIDIVNPETKAKLKELNDTSARLAKELRETRKQENVEKDHLETWITVLNLLLVPLLIILFGIALAAKRHALQAAH